jgi:hypothetical protein
VLGVHSVVTVRPSLQEFIHSERHVTALSCNLFTLTIKLCSLFPFMAPMSVLDSYTVTALHLLCFHSGQNGNFIVFVLHVSEEVKRKKKKDAVNPANL